MIVYLSQALNLFVKLTLCIGLFRVNNNVYACILVNTICFVPGEYMIPSLHVYTHVTITTTGRIIIIVML